MTPGPTTTVPARPEPLLRRLVGAAFRRRRAAQGRTLADVATEARISIAYLSEIERGRKEPSSEVLVAVCRALGMRLADLLAEASADLRAVEVRAVRREVVELSGVRHPGTAAPAPLGGTAGASATRQARAAAALRSVA